MKINHHKHELRFQANVFDERGNIIDTLYDDNDLCTELLEEIQTKFDNGDFDE